MKPEGRWAKAKYSGQDQPARLLELLAQVQHSDRRATRRGNWGCLLVLAGLGGGAAQLFWSPAQAWPVVLSLAAVLLGCLSFFGSESYNLQDVRYQLPWQFLQAVSNRLQPDQPVRWLLDLSEPNTARTATDGSMPRQLVLELQATEGDGASLCLRVERVEQWARSGHGRQSRSSVRQWLDIQLERESTRPMAEPAVDDKPELRELTNLEWSLQGNLLQVKASTLPESLPASAAPSQVGLEIARVLDWFKAGSSI